MKYARWTVLLCVLVPTLVAGWVFAATLSSTGAPPASTGPVVVPAEESQAQWQAVAPQPKVGEKLRMAAFFNEKFGLTGGAGDVGKARYTLDGSKTWAVADSSGG